MLKVVRVVEGFDMRKVHELRDSLPARRLSAGEVLLAFNTIATIARFIDSAGAVHSYYSEPGEAFDVDALAELVREGLGVELRSKSPMIRPLKQAA